MIKLHLIYQPAPRKEIALKGAKYFLMKNQIIHNPQAVIMSKQIIKDIPIKSNAALSARVFSI